MANITPIRILSIDGGGMRGIVPGQLLVSLEKKLREKYPDKPFLADHFDLMAGTSTGGILTCACLLPDRNDPTRPSYTAENVLGLYLNEGDKIFSLSAGQRIRSFFGLTEEKYSARNFEEVMKTYFGEVWLSELLRPCVITSYDMEHRRGHFFKKHEAEKPGQPEYNFLVRDVARATASGPTYFECSNIRSANGEHFPLIDGGVFASNPSLCAFAEARKLFETDASNMILLSLGTGTSKEPYPWKKVRRWGKLAWLMPLIDIMRSGVREVAHYELEEIFAAAGADRNYLRIDTELPDDVDPAMDNASRKNRLALARVGEELAERYDRELEELVGRI